MWRCIRKRIFSLQKDESGQIIVFVCVFTVAILIFTLSLLNIGHISNEKIKLQNAADFAALNAATWQARAMNIEGLFNTTVTADIVLQAARSLVTGVPPDEMPPNWIQLQQSAQDWLQQSFNKGFNPLQEQVLGKGAEFSIDGGFGTDMARLAGVLNGNFLTSAYPPQIPLYVYRYRFFDADYNVNPVVGAENFVERAINFDYIPAEPGGANRFYKSGALPFSQSEPDAPDELGYVEWEHEIKLGGENSIIWPENSDLVRLYSGGPDNLNKNGLQYDLIEDLGLELNPAKQEELVQKLREAINDVVDRFGEPDELDSSNSVVNIIKNYVRANLTSLNINPDDPEFRKLFVYPPIEPIDLTFDGKNYIENSSNDPANSIGRLVIRIFPSVGIGVFPKEARAHLINDDYELNQPDGQIQPSQLSSYNNITRWYDTVAKKEFWNLQTTRFEKEQVAKEWVPPVYKWVSTKTGGYRVKVKDGYWQCRYKVTCPVCGDTTTTGWIKHCSEPSNSTCLSLMGTEHKYYSDLQPSERHHRGDCVQRKWWYYAFGVEFNVTVKAYMNLDFSTLLMAKYTSSTDIKQLERPGNEYVKNLIPYYDKCQRNIMTTCLRPAQDLKFGKNFFRIKPTKVPYDLKEYAPDLADGTVPSAEVYSYAKHLQRAEDGRDITESSDDLFFGMNWYSIPTSAIPVTESIFDE